MEDSEEKPGDECESGMHGGGAVTGQNSGDQIEDEPEGLVKTLRKGLEKTRDLLAGCVIDKGDSSESSSQEQSPSHPTSPDPDTYDFTHPNRGRAIIINNEHFHGTSGYDSRPGSKYDEMSLKEVFKKLGFDVKVYTDLTAIEIKQSLEREAKKYDHTKADCLAVAVLSHGDEELYKAVRGRRQELVRQDLVVGVDGNAISTGSIIRTFQDSRCPGLKGKPRLFFFQACRGANFDSGQNVRVRKDEDEGDTQVKGSGDESASGTQKPDVGAAAGGEGEEQTDAVAVSPEGSGDEDDEDVSDAYGVPSRSGERKKISPAPIFKDFLVMYATPPGYFAWRRGTGSWFVQSLHAIFTKHYKPDMSLTQALTSVTRMVAQGYEAKGTKLAIHSGKKQTPVMESMLVKDIYFAPK